MLASKKGKRPVGLVTGAGGFLGRAISLKLAQEGYDLILHARSHSAEIEKLTGLVKKLGAKAKSVLADLGRPDLFEGSFKPALEDLGRLDLLVNSASLFRPTSLGKDGPGEWEELLTVNLIAPYFLSQVAAPWLKRSAGSIVNMTDIYGEHPVLPHHAAYCASKAGLLNLTKALALELGPQVRVNAVSPGAIFIPKAYGPERKRELIQRSVLKRQGTAEEIAQAVHFMASHRFVTGQVLAVDGGRFL